LLSTLFFLKYAFDENLINEWGRVIIGLVAGFGMLAGGDIARRKGLKIFAQGLVGASIPILYLSIYAAYEFYALVPHAAAFLAMAGVGGISLLVALRHDSIFIAVLGAVGGYLTPALLSTGEVNTVGLFSFIAILDAALVLMALRKREWLFIHLLVLVGTWAWWMMWTMSMEPTMQTEGAYASIRPLAVAFAWFFAIGSVVYDRLLISRGYDGARQELSVIAGINMLASWFAIWRATNGQAPWHDELSMGLFAVVMAVYAWDIRRHSWSPLMAAVRDVMAIIVLFMLPTVWREAMIEHLWWAALGVAVVFYHRDRSIRLLPWSGFMILAIGVAVTVLDPTYVDFTEEGLPVLNRQTGPLLLLIIGLLVVTPVLQAREQVASLTKLLQLVRPLMVPAIIIAIHTDTVRYGEAMGDLAAQYSGIEAQIWSGYLARCIATAVTALLGLGVVWWGRRSDDAPLQISGVLVIGSAALLWIADLVNGLPDGHYTFIFNIRAAVGLIVIGILARLSVRSGLAAPSMPAKQWKQWMGAALGVMVLVWVSVEVPWHYLIVGEMDAYQLTLSSVWVVYGGVLLWLGFARRSRAIRVGAILMLGLSILKVFLYDLSYLEQPYRIISFIVLGVLLLGASYVYTRFKDLILDAEHRPSERDADDDVDTTKKPPTS